MEPLSDALRDHGDRQVPAGAVDFAVNVLGPTPAWLVEELRGVDLVGYPDPAPATAAVAARHGTSPDEVLVLAGAAEAFWLVAHALRPRLAACVHPSFTGPEAALRASGVPVHRVLRDPADDWRLEPAAVPEEADLVVLGRPDNPTGRLEPVELVAALARPGRVIVVDEAFVEFLPDGSGLHASGIPGLVCVRSLTKLWGLAGLRAGYLLGPSDLVARLRDARQPWPVGSLALRAIELLVPAEDERRRRSAAVAADRDSHARCPGVSPADRLALAGQLPAAAERATGPAHPSPRARGGGPPRRDLPGARPAPRAGGGASGPCCPGRPLLGAGFDSGRGARAGASARTFGTPARSRPLPHRPARCHPAPWCSVGPGPASHGTLSGCWPTARRFSTSRRDRFRTAATDDWAARVAEHRRNRPEGWTTLETDDVPAVLERAAQPVLVDCLATWLAGVMGAAGAWESADGDTAWHESVDGEVDRLLKAWQSASVPVVAVSNEVGSGVVPGTRSGVLFRDALGRLNRRVADLTDDVRLVVAGRVQRLDGERA